MPKLRLVPDQIREAAQALLDAGRSPTVIAVRNHLGGGSPQIIAPVLALWLAERQGTAELPEDSESERAEMLDEIGRQDERIDALLAALGAAQQALAEERCGSRMRAGSVTRLG
jgi:hypothetical protein